MKTFLMLLLAIICFQSSSAQTIDFDKIMFQGLTSSSSKELIIEKLGGPHTVYEPNYECGFLSSEEQSKDFFNLDYTNYIFTGNETDNYILKEICFKNDSIVLDYAEYRLNSETDTITLAKIFGEDAFTNLQSNNGLVVIPNKNRMSEDGYMFEIKNGKLISIHYWSPC